MPDKAIMETKEDIRQLTKLFGSRTMTREIALYVLLRDHREAVMTKMGNCALNAEQIMKQIEQKCNVKHKKKGELIIDSGLERIFTEASEKGNISALIDLLIEAGNFPEGMFGTDPSWNRIRNIRQIQKLDLEKKSEEMNVDFCTDLTYQVSVNEHVFFGREEELEQLITVLMCRKKKNALLIGESGVGKTAIVEALANLIIAGEVPTGLVGSKVLTLNLASLLGGASGRGDFEERVKELVGSLENCSRHIILFIDEFHSIVGLGSEGNFDLANLLKPILARNKLSCIGATTYREYKMYVEKDGALVRRFQNIQVPEPSVENTRLILKHVKASYEKYHGVYYQDNALKACAELTDRYIPNRHLPDKALDVMDESGVVVRRAQQKWVTRDVIETLIAKKYHIPIGRQEMAGREQIRKMDDQFSKITGYQFEKEKLKKLLFASQIITEEAKANCVILFTGCYDLGSEKLIKVVRKVYFPVAEAYMELDLSGYQEKHMLSKLIGAPPGYIGSQDSGILLDRLKKYARILLIIRNLSNAHPQIIEFINKLLLGSVILDSYGNSVCLRGAIVILDNCASNSLIPCGMDQMVCGTVEFQKLNHQELYRLSQEYLISITNELKKQNIQLEIHDSVYNWLESCTVKTDSERELRQYIYKNAMELLYELSIISIAHERFQLYQDNDKLMYRKMED